MRILLIATEDHLGAGKATYRVLDVLRKKGHQVCFLVKNKTLNDPDIVAGEIRQPPILIHKYRNLVKRIKGNILTDPDYYFFGIGDPDLRVDIPGIKKKLPFNPEVIVFTWISRFMNAGHIYELQQMTGARVIAYPMDMSLFTGGCHYAWNSTGFRDCCDPCPAIQSQKGRNVPSKILFLKKKYYSLSGVKLIAPTSQLQAQAMNSSLFRGQTISKQLLPVDESVFNPFQRLEAKSKLGLREDSKVIFFGSSFTTEKRKGIHLFIESLQKLHASLIDKPVLCEKITVMIAGNKKDNEMLSLIPFPAHFTGYINDDKQLSLHYQAADLFVSSSIQDSGPMMINEAILCGTPVIAFQIGVADDLIIDEVSGYKLRIEDTDDMAAKMELILSREDDPVFHEKINRIGLERTSFASFSANQFLQQ